MKTLITMICMVALMICAVAQAQEVTPQGEARTIADTATSILGSASTTCTKGNLSRTVEITYAGEQGKAPCEVHYKKVTEAPGHDQVLWSAEHKSGYCEKKKREFVDKLTSWGWSCS
ncbi:MAG: hypothetical protein KAT58_12960 [candidate division Zixibacteria bacterium]|nr:hypothetical protein [candidate division Zixibacteria bacterium]